ncbi:hypothetical protein ACTFIZ_008612 [Dictyostelium cf. discoideum]
MTGFTSPNNKHSTPPTTSPLNKGFEPTTKNSSLINSICIGEFNDYPLHQDCASIIKGNINLANVRILFANLALNPTTTETTSITTENKVVNLKITLEENINIITSNIKNSTIKNSNNESAEKIDFESLKTNVPSLLSNIKACLLDSIQFYDSFIPVTNNNQSNINSSSNNNNPSITPTKRVFTVKQVGQIEEIIHITIQHLKEGGLYFHKIDIDNKNVKIWFEELISIFRKQKLCY